MAGPQDWEAESRGTRTEPQTPERHKPCSGAGDRAGSRLPAAGPPTCLRMKLVEVVLPSDLFNLLLRVVVPRAT